MPIHTVSATSFHAEIWGWSIDQGPPPVPGDSQFAPSPTTPVQVATATTHVVPPQTLELNTGTITPTANLNLSYAKWDGGQQAWHVDRALFGIKAATPTPITITFRAKAVHHSGHLNVSNYPILVSGGALWSTRFKVHTNSFQTYTVVMPATAWYPGFKGLFLTAEDDSGAKIVIQSITASTEQVDITAEYFWTCVFQGHARPDGTEGKSVTVTEGITTSTTETDSFAVSIGAELGVDYEGIGGKLSTTFSYEHVSSHTISVSKETSTTETLSVTPSKNAMTFQFWQLCMQFTTNTGETLTQKLSLDEAPLVEHTFTSAPAMAPAD